MVEQLRVIREKTKVFSVKGLKAFLKKTELNDKNFENKDSNKNKNFPNVNAGPKNLEFKDLIKKGE